MSSTLRIDSHQHFWRLERGDYHWMGAGDEPLMRDFMPEDLQPHLDAAGIHRTVLVQVANTAAETDFILDIAQATDMVAGVIGWVDLEARGAPRAIAELAARPKLCGIRRMNHDVPEPGWMLHEELTPAIGALVEHGLPFDAHVYPRHLKNLLTLMGRHPDLAVVLAHGAKPRIRDGAFADWAADIAVIAAGTGAFCKLSGLTTLAAPGWTSDTLEPYIEHLFACFGPDRLMWGSDWPPVTLGGGYAAWWEASVRALASRDQPTRDAVLGGAAARFYGLEAAAPTSPASELGQGTA